MSDSTVSGVMTSGSVICADISVSPIQENEEEGCCTCIRWFPCHAGTTSTACTALHQPELAKVLQESIGKLKVVKGGFHSGIGSRETGNQEGCCGIEDWGFHLHQKGSRVFFDLLQLVCVSPFGLCVKLSSMHNLLSLAGWYW